MLDAILLSSPQFHASLSYLIPYLSQIDLYYGVEGIEPQYIVVIKKCLLNTFWLEALPSNKHTDRAA